MREMRAVRFVTYAMFLEREERKLHKIFRRRLRADHVHFIRNLHLRIKERFVLTELVER